MSEKEHKRNIRIPLAVLSAMSLAATAACSSNEAASGSDQDGEVTYTIGLVAPLAGPASDAGVRARNTMNIFIEQMNEGEHVKLADGTVVKFRMVEEDTKASPEGQITAIRKLSSDADALVGGLLSSPTMAGFEVAEAQGIPYLITGATTNQIEEAIAAEDMTYPFHIAQNASTRVTDDMSSAYELLGAEADNVFIIVQDTDYGRDVEKYANEWIESVGAAAQVEYVPAATTDYSTTLLKLSNMDPQPDWLYVGLVGEEMFSFAQQKHDAGNETFFVGATNTSSSSNFTEELPADVTENVLTNLVWVPGAGNDEYGFADAYEAANDRIPTDVEATTYDAGLLLAAAIMAADSVDREDVAMALETVEINGLRGEQSLDPDTHGHGPLTVAMAQIRDGEFVPVYPESIATGNFQP